MRNISKEECKEELNKKGYAIRINNNIYELLQNGVTISRIQKSTSSTPFCCGTYELGAFLCTIEDNKVINLFIDYVLNSITNAGGVYCTFTESQYCTRIRNAIQKRRDFTFCGSHVNPNSKNRLYTYFSVLRH